MNTIHVDIVSAEGEIFSGEARMVFLPASEGEIGVTPRHAQLPEGDEQFFYVGSGALEVQPTKVTVLADTAARAKDLDEAAAIAARQQAEQALAGHLDKITQAEALAELARAIAQIKLIEKLRKVG